MNPEDYDVDQDNRRRCSVDELILGKKKKGAKKRGRSPSPGGGKRARKSKGRKEDLTKDMEDPLPETVAEKVEDGGIPPRSLNLAELVPEKKVSS